jgi:integrase
MTEKRINVWVQRRPDRATLCLQWFDPETGKRKSKSAETADPEEAEARRVDLESDLNNGRYQEASRMGWEGFRELFEAEYLPGVRPLTAKKYREVFDVFESLVRPGKVRAVTERTLSAFLAAMRQRKVRGRVGMAPGTMRVYLQLLHTALSWGVDQGFLPKCPKFPAVKVPRRKPQPVPVESFERLLAKAPEGDWRALLLTAWLAGLRVGEAYALVWEPGEEAPWVDLASDRIRLPAKFAKADEDQWVPIDPALRPILEARLGLGGKVFNLRARDGHPLALSSVSDHVIRLARRAGVRLTMHALRRGFGCRYAGKVPAQVLQRLMRHSDIRTTMAYYANVDAAVEEAVLGPRCTTLCTRPGTTEGEDKEGVNGNGNPGRTNA